MSFGGAVSAMITSLKNNKRSRRIVFGKLKTSKKTTSTKIEFKNKATPEQLKEIRERLQKENKKRKKSISLFIGISFVLVLILFILFNYIKF